jgi:hypothetical protein
VVADILSYITSLTVIATCVFVAMQTNEAKKSRISLEKQTAEAQRTREMIEAEIAPHVQVYPYFDKDHQARLRIQNIGKSPAKNVSISFDPLVDPSIFPGGVPYVLSGQLFDLPAGQEIDPSPYFQGLEVPDFPTGQHVVITYDALTPASRTEAVSINGRMFDGLGYVRISGMASAYANGVY